MCWIVLMNQLFWVILIWLDFMWFDMTWFDSILFWSCFWLRPARRSCADPLPWPLAGPRSYPALPWVSAGPTVVPLPCSPGEHGRSPSVDPWGGVHGHTQPSADPLPWPLIRSNLILFIFILHDLILSHLTLSYLISSYVTIPYFIFSLSLSLPLHVSLSFSSSLSVPFYWSLSLPSSLSLSLSLS